MIYHVHAVEQDLGGNWYARVVITEGMAVFFKFQEYPTMDAIQEAARDYVASVATAGEVSDGATE